MVKRKREFNIDQRIKEGRGQGTKTDYIPWLFIQDVPSLGRATRINGWKTKRVHHLLSDLERSYFYILEWSETVTDIREQFPLLPLEETLEIAEEYGIKHPENPRTREPIVMTTDFLINVGEKEVARTIKMAEELESDNVLKKFEIERIYWERRNIDWGIVTEKEIPKQLVKNIEWFHKEYINEDVDELGLNTVKQIEIFIRSQIEGNPNISLSRATSTTDDKLGLVPGTSLAMVRYFIANKKWKLNMDLPIIPSNPIGEILFNEKVKHQKLFGGLA